MPPSDWPATAIRAGSISPDSGEPGFALAASSREITKLTSPGSLTRSDSSGPPGAPALSNGKTGAATT